MYLVMYTMFCLYAGCSHYLYAGNWHSVRGVHSGQHTAARYHCQQRDQRAAPHRTEGVQEPLGGERHRERLLKMDWSCEYEQVVHDSA